MGQSIMQNGEPRCFLCGRTVGLERHHILGGANRKWSEKYGLWVYLCGESCHRGTDGAQYNRDLNQRLKRLAQIAFEARHSHEMWMNVFGKSYL